MYYHYADEKIKYFFFFHSQNIVNGWFSAWKDILLKLCAEPTTHWLSKMKTNEKRNLHETTLWGGGGGKGETQEIGMLILIAYCIFFAFLFQSCLVESRVLQSSDFLQLFQWVLATMVYIPSCFLCIVMVSMNETSKDVSIEMLSHTGCNFQGYHCISVRVWQF